MFRPRKSLVLGLAAIVLSCGLALSVRTFLALVDDPYVRLIASELALQADEQARGVEWPSDEEIEEKVKEMLDRSEALQELRQEWLGNPEEALDRFSDALDLANGEELTVGHIFIVGNDHVSDGLIRQAVALYPGQRLRRWRVAQAEFRLATLGLSRWTASAGERKEAASASGEVIASVASVTSACHTADAAQVDVHQPYLLPQDQGIGWCHLWG